MRHSLDIRVFGDKAFLDSIVDKLPAADDPRIDAKLYNAPRIGEDEDGRLQLNAMIRFVKEADRDTVEDAVFDLKGMFADATSHHRPIGGWPRRR